mmetsp:Transcript_32062/g.91461  ORF Transcript_32062/g.91461 Transcript_32062/m.91461 type:complete len:350 (-) Transcript_32062:81-1130(-)
MCLLHYRNLLVGFTNIPQSDTGIISHGRNQIGVFGMPIHIFHHIRVARENRFRIDSTTSSRSITACAGLIDIPQTHSMIFTPTQQISFFQRRPTHGISFLGMTQTGDLRVEKIISILGWKGWMFGQVKDVDFARRTSCRHKEMILGHVSGSIDFTRMTNLHANFNLANRGIVHNSTTTSTICSSSSTSMPKSSHFLAIFIVVLGRLLGRKAIILGIFLVQRRAAIAAVALINHCVILGEIARSDHEIILFSCRMSSEQERMFLHIGRSHVLLDSGKPLAGQTGPLQCVSHHDVVEIGSILLPDFVLGINQSFLQNVRDFALSRSGSGSSSCHDGFMNVCMDVCTVVLYS